MSMHKTISWIDVDEGVSLLFDPLENEVIAISLGDSKIVIPLENLDELIRKLYGMMERTLPGMDP